MVSNIKGNREVATEETGYLCDPKAPDSYAAALAGLCADPGLRQKMSTAARARAEAEFDLHQTFRKVAELYEKLLADRVEPARN